MSRIILAILLALPMATGIAAPAHARALIPYQNGEARLKKLSGDASRGAAAEISKNVLKILQGASTGKTALQEAASDDDAHQRLVEANNYLKSLRKDPELGPQAMEVLKEMATSDSIAAGQAYESQGDCKDAVRHGYDVEKSTVTCPGLASKSITFTFDSGINDECLYIDNTSQEKESYFVPTRTRAEWEAFKESTQSGKLKDRVVLSYGCRAQALEDGCGGKAQATESRDGAQVQVAVTGERRVTYACQASDGCGTWTKTAVEGECPVGGVCGPQNGLAVESLDRAALCAKGEASDLRGDGPWAWTCKGLHGGASIDCQAQMKFDGACGVDAGQSLRAPPANLCATGKPGQVLGEGPWTWTCSGGSGGREVVCTANRALDGKCGPADSNEFSEMPTALCTAGAASAVSGTGPWHWTCQGNLGGESASCSARLAQRCNPVDILSFAQDTAFTNVGGNRWRYGAIGDNYWGGWCTNYHRNLIFNISDLKGVKAMKMVWGGWDDWMNIALNGVPIVSVPWEHTKTGIPECELSTSWAYNVNPQIWGALNPVGDNQKLLNVSGSGRLLVNRARSGRKQGFVTYDLEPYLVRGVNVFTMDVNVAGGGEGWMDIIIQSDPAQCVDANTNKCGGELVERPCPNSSHVQQVLVKHSCDASGNQTGDEEVPLQDCSIPSEFQSIAPVQDPAPAPNAGTSPTDPQPVEAPTYGSGGDGGG